MEVFLKMDSKFVPSYIKHGKWLFANQTMSLVETEQWFRKQNVEKTTLTTIIPYNCEICPSWMRRMYVKMKLNHHFGPEEL